MSHKLNTAITVVGIDIGKNSFHRLMRCNNSEGQSFSKETTSRAGKWVPPF